MAKMKKRREADFTTGEMAELSNCKSEQTFMNRLNLVCHHYGIDHKLFKMDEYADASENFFPAECGELVALLVKFYKDNPAVKADKDLRGVTSESICNFYKEMMEAIDELPTEIKNMVYAMPSHFTSNRITLWLERLVPVMTQFILNYIDEQSEDMGAMLQRLCVDMDKASYDLFWNYKFIRMVQQIREEKPEQYEQWRIFEYGDDADKKIELEDKINAMNVSIDVAIAELIKRLMMDISKESILDAPDAYDNQLAREQYYPYLEEYIEPGDVMFKQETWKLYSQGAKSWKTVEERIREGDYIPEDIHLTYESELKAREDYISDLKKKLKDAESALERFKNQGEDWVKGRNHNAELMVREINEEYIRKCERIRKDEQILRDKTDKYISHVIWSFLNVSA